MPLLEIIMAIGTLTILWFAAVTVFRRNPVDSSPVLPYVQQESTHIVTQYSSHGSIFQDYVMSKFDPHHYRLVHVPAQNIANLFPLSNKDPDMVFEYTDHHHRIRFAVECKWKENFEDDFIAWARIAQIHHYYHYQQHENVPVFIILGIGGEMAQPQQLYVVPLLAIHQHQSYLSRVKLQPFSKSVHSPFFFDSSTLELR